MDKGGTEMTEPKLCPRCGSPMREVDKDVFEESESTHYYFECPSCNMTFDAEVPNENVNEPVEIRNQGFGRCPVCGAWLAWSADFMLSDFEGEELPDEDDTLVQTLNCLKCGASLTAFYPKE